MVSPQKIRWTGGKENRQWKEVRMELDNGLLAGLKTWEWEKRAETTEGTDSEYIWFRGELGCDWVNSLPAITGACFLSKSAWMFAFLLTGARVYTHTTKPLYSVINPSLLAGVVFFLFPLYSVLAFGAIFHRSALLALCCGNTIWDLSHQTTLGPGKTGRREYRL